MKGTRTLLPVIKRIRTLVKHSRLDKHNFFVTKEKGSAEGSVELSPVSCPRCCSCEVWDEICGNADKCPQCLKGDGQICTNLHSETCADGSAISLRERCPRQEMDCVNVRWEPHMCTKVQGSAGEAAGGPLLSNATQLAELLGKQLYTAEDLALPEQAYVYYKGVNEKGIAVQTVNLKRNANTLGEALLPVIDKIRTLVHRMGMDEYKYVVLKKKDEPAAGSAELFPVHCAA